MAAKQSESNGEAPVCVAGLQVTAEVIETFVLGSPAQKSEYPAYRPRSSGTPGC